jgi:GNAT superfamily N-acetyltransferase
MPDLEIRESGPEDIGEVTALLDRCFTSNPKIDPEVMMWQYWSNPFGNTRSWVAVSDGMIVGHHAAYTVPLRAGVDRLSAAIQVDTATDPNFRGRGLYGELSKVLYASCRDDGVSVMLGNPNAQALGPLRRVGWIEVGDLRLFLRLRDAEAISRMTPVPTPIARAGHPLVFGKPYRTGASVASTVPDELDSLVEDCRSHDLIGVDTSVAWWKWRFEEHPLRPYQFVTVRDADLLVAAAVCGVRREGGEVLVDIMDIVARDRGAALTAVDGAFHAVPEASGVRITANLGSSYARVARWGKLRRVPRRLRSNPTYFGIYPLDPSRDFSDDTWDVSLGTLDYA